MLGCLIVHGCLMVLRTASFVLFEDIPAGTYGLAATEWGIFISAAALYFCRT
jgi:hypothetical protein